MNSVDNFQRLRTHSPSHSDTVSSIEKAIASIEDSILREKLYQKINVELGVLLLRNKEIESSLQKLMTSEIFSPSFI